MKKEIIDSNNRKINYATNGWTEISVKKLLADLQLADIDYLTIISYFVVGTDEADYCFAYYKEYPSICTQGKTIEEATKKLKEYITVYINKRDKSKFNNIMLDIETLGDTPGSVVTSIGAVRFDIETGEVGEKFHQFIPLSDSLNSGFTVTANTLLWWLKQPTDSLEYLTDGLMSAKDSLLYVLENFTDFVTKDDIIWAKSPRFDCSILGHVYTKVGYDIPWNFRNERDVRTLSAQCPQVEKNWKFTGTKHDALSDCYNQIGYCSEIWKILKNKFGKMPISF